jgi:hypothetical protein
MNYQKTYSSLIAKAQARTALIGYKERHHILPRSMGGTDDASNLVNLTAREHFIAHYLLAKIHGGNQWAAIIRFKHGNKKSYFNSKLYEIGRINHSIQVSKVHKGVKRSKETCVNISNSLKGKPQPLTSLRMKGNAYGKANKGKSHSDETLIKISLAVIEGQKSPEVRKRMQEKQLGKKHSEQTKAKRNAKLKGQKRSLETCLKMGLAKKGIKHSEQARLNNSRAQKLFNIKKRFLVVSTQYLTSAEWC